MENNEGDNEEDTFSSLSSLSNHIEETNIPLNKEILFNSYTCNKCNSIPEIIDIDYNNNIMKIKCSNHQGEITLDDFIYEGIKHNYYFSVCDICNKNVQKYDECIFKYCYDCKKIICLKCYANHNSEHKIINHNEYNIKCVKHFNQAYTSFCRTCNENICIECKRSQKHRDHNKCDFIEIEPTENEISFVNKFCQQLKDNINVIECSVQKEIEEMKKIKNQRLIKIKQNLEKQNEIISEDARKKINQIGENLSNKKKDLKRKYEMDLKTLNDDYEFEKNKIVDQLKAKLIWKELEYNDKKAKIESDFNSLIIKLYGFKNNLKLKNNNIIQLNKILLNSYYKNKNQYYYIINAENNINFIKKYKEQMPNLFIMNINNIYNTDINEEKINIQKSIISNEGIKRIISNMDNDKIKNIIISYASIYDLSFLGNSTFNNLKLLSIINCHINNIKNLQNINFPQIKRLDISENAIADISSLKNSNLKSLETLNLSNNYISDISILGEDIFSNLKEIDLSYNKIKDIKILSYVKFTSIRAINLSYNLITNVNGFNWARFKNLTNKKIDNQNEPNYLSKKKFHN